MDKQTCAALLNLLGFNVYDMTLKTFFNSEDINSLYTMHDNTFLLRSSTPYTSVGTVVNIDFGHIHFESYDKMINFARAIYEKNT